jgi:hypothetical protein
MHKRLKFTFTADIFLHVCLLQINFREFYIKQSYIQHRWIIRYIEIVTFNTFAFVWIIWVILKALIRLPAVHVASKLFLHKPALYVMLQYSPIDETSCNKPRYQTYKRSQYCDCLQDGRTGLRIPAGARVYLYTKTIQTGPSPHTTSYPMGTEVLC